MDLRTLDWDPGILHVFGIPPAMLPRIVASAGPEAGGRTAEAGVFHASLPINGILGDQQAALIGQCCFAQGDVKNTYGTGCFMLLNTGERPVRSRHGLLTTVAYRFAGQRPVYALEGAVAIAGALVQWLRDNLGLIGRSGEVEALAASVADNGGVYFVPAFAGLFAPYWRADARGVLVGLTRYANRGHIARAALEATCYQVRDVLDAMRRDAELPLELLRVDGGMVGNELLMQFQADILGMPTVRPTIRETTALGAAYAAGLAAGVWASPQELRTHWQADKRWEPAMDTTDRERLCAAWRKAVERSLNWVE
jgi:glycerol kinase